MRPQVTLAEHLKAKDCSRELCTNKEYIKHSVFSIIHIFFFALIICATSSTRAQINSDGVPFLHNYDPKTYKAEETNYSATQDHRGIVYIGNAENILEYDGQSWTKIPVPDQKLIISLVTDDNNTVYVGAVNDFGHLITDKHGKLTYQSLSSLLPDSVEISRVWKTYASNTKIYFCTLQQIFVYDTNDKAIEIINIPFEYNFFSFLINDNLYTGNFEKGLLILKDKTYELAPGGAYYAKKDIFSMLNYGKDTIIISTYEGLTLYTPSTGESKNFKSINPLTNSFFEKTPIYSGCKIGNDLFAYGTLGGGLFIMDKDGEIVNHINKNSGLQNERISQVFLLNDNSGILWLTTEQGITSINLSSPVRQFVSQQGLEETVYAINKHENQIHIATTNGVSQMKIAKAKETKFVPIKGITSENTTSLLNFEIENKSIQIAGTIKDIYEIKGNKAKPLNIGTETYKLMQSKVAPEKLYAATSRGIRVIRYKNKKFIADENYIGLPKQLVTQLEEDNYGNIWSTTLSERQLIDKNGNLLELPEPVKSQNGFFFKLKNTIYYATEKQVFELNGKTKAFEEHQWLTNKYQKSGKIIKKVIALNEKTALVHFSHNHKLASDLIYLEQENWHADSTVLKIIPSMTVNTAMCDQHKIYIGGSEGLFVANMTRKKNFNNPYSSLIRSITIGNDSILFKGATGIFEEIDSTLEKTIFASQEIDYQLNNISFSYAAPFFENEEEIKYRSYLQGFDKQWSPWTRDIARTYTNLKEGDYKFQVEAKNIYNLKSSIDSFAFTIAPPWYRTWWAFMIYLIIAFIIIRIAIALYTRKLQEDKKRLEKIVEERTAEIVEKNKRIEKQNISITDSIKYAKRIQTAVLPDKQTSDLFEYFIYFKPKDIVSGDFYWVYHFEKDQRLIVVAADCTGHGVPGAFMSMLGTSFLNEIVAKLDVSHSDIVLNQLRENVIKTLNQGSKEHGKEEQKDGMDMAIASIDLNTKILEFSGANNPLVLIRDNELIEYKPDKMPIGLYVKQDIPFTRHEIQLQKDDIFYIFSDGYVDQFGGTQGRKYMKKRFKEFLLQIHREPIEKQKEMIYEEMFNWMDGTEQIDDQIVIGMRLVK